MAAQTGLNKKKGFTLLEMAIVLSVLAVISAAVLISGSGVRANAGFFKDSNRLLDALLEARSQSVLAGGRAQLQGQGNATVYGPKGKCAFGIHFFLKDEPIDRNPTNSYRQNDGFITFRDTYNLSPSPPPNYDCDDIYERPGDHGAGTPGEEINFFSLPAQVFEFQSLSYDLPGLPRVLPVTDVVFSSYDGNAACHVGGNVYPDCTGGGVNGYIVLCLKSNDPGIQLSRRLVVSGFGGISMDATPCP